MAEPSPSPRQYEGSYRGFPSNLVSKESACNAGQEKKRIIKHSIDSLLYSKLLLQLSHLGVLLANEKMLTRPVNTGVVAVNYKITAENLKDLFCRIVARIHFPHMRAVYMIAVGKLKIRKAKYKLMITYGFQITKRWTKITKLYVLQHQATDYCIKVSISYDGFNIS